MFTELFLIMTRNFTGKIYKIQLRTTYDTNFFDYAYKNKGFSVHKTQIVEQCSGSPYNKLIHSSSLLICKNNHLLYHKPFCYDHLESISSDSQKNLDNQHAKKLSDLYPWWRLNSFHKKRFKPCWFLEWSSRKKSFRTL